MHAELRSAVEAGIVTEIEQHVAALSLEDRLNAVLDYCSHRDDEPAPLDAIRLLLDAGCPTDSGSSLHHLTPLHCAA